MSAYNFPSLASALVSASSVAATSFPTVTDPQKLPHQKVSFSISAQSSIMNSLVKAIRDAHTATERSKVVPDTMYPILFNACNVLDRIKVQHRVTLWKSVCCCEWLVRWYCRKFHKTTLTPLKIQPVNTDLVRNRIARRVQTALRKGLHPSACVYIIKDAKTGESFFKTNVTVTKVFPFIGRPVSLLDNGLIHAVTSTVNFNGDSVESE